MDPRYHKLAERLTNYSLAIKNNETVFIEAVDIPETFVLALIRAVRSRGAHPLVSIRNQRIQRELFHGATEKQFSIINSIELHRFKKVDAYITIRGTDNVFEYSDVPANKIDLATKLMKPAFNWRVKKTCWVVLRWPTSSMAQQCFKSTEAFEDFFFDVCTFDYAKMLPGMRALKKLMDSTENVHIKSPGTDLYFSIKDIPSVVCAATYNVPDGEVFTAPVKDSVEGYITYNAPSVYQGCSFENVRLEFKKGKIIKATANETKRINQIFDIDKGARYVGEFALGLNPPYPRAYARYSFR